MHWRTRACMAEQKLDAIDFGKGEAGSKTAEAGEKKG
jgi:hypothetical protein